jgi:hypothetical protein
MHVVIQHRIKDPEQFFSGDAEQVASGGPPGIRGRQFIVCLWEADSVDSLRNYMEELTGESSENTYFEVDPETSMGLPEAARASA